jgi:hypothetical protein
MLAAGPACAPTIQKGDPAIDQAQASNGGRRVWKSVRD